MFLFTTRAKAKKLQSQGFETIDVSSRGIEPYVFLSPFYPHGKIPVIGMRNTFSDSVEGIWQGLKIIDGNIDPSRFKGRGKKRPGKISGHLYYDEVIGYKEARHLIYKPTYISMLLNCPKANKLVKELSLRMLEDPEKVIYMYDFDTNSDINNTSKPLAHASLLVEFLNENIQELIYFQNDPEEAKTIYLEEFMESKGMKLPDTDFSKLSTLEKQFLRMKAEGFTSEVYYSFPLAKQIIQDWFIQGLYLD